MPKIQFQPAEQNIPGVGGNVEIPIGSAGLPGQALHQTGMVAEEAIGSNLNEYTKIKKQEELAKQEWLKRANAAGIKESIVKSGVDRARNDTSFHEMFFETDPITGEKVRRTDKLNFVPETELFNKNELQSIQSNFLENPEGFQHIQVELEHHHAQRIIKAKEMAWEATKKQWNDNFVTSIPTMKDYITNSDNINVAIADVDKWEKGVRELIKEGVVPVVQGEAGIQEVKRGGMLQRAKNDIDIKPDSWLYTPEKYPFLENKDVIDLNRYALQEQKQHRVQKQQELHELQQENAGNILVARGKSIEGKKLFGMKELNSMAMDANGRLLIDPNTYSHLQSLAISDQERADRGERREPEMTPSLWEKYGQASEDVIWGRSSYAKIAKLASILPDAQIKSLMAMQGALDKKDVKETTTGPKETPEQKVYKAGTNKYIDSFKVMMSKEMFGELRHEIDTMFLNPKIDPEDYKSKADEILKKYQADAFKRRLSDSLGWISGGKKPELPKPEPTKPQVNEKVINGVKYKKVDGEWFKENTL
jgi:hypothetical protein